MERTLNDLRVPEVESTEAIPASRKARRTGKQKLSHDEVICISMYSRHLDGIDAKVAQLKKRSTKAKNSKVLRVALRRLSIDDLAVDSEGDLTSSV